MISDHLSHFFVLSCYIGYIYSHHPATLRSACGAVPDGIVWLYRLRGHSLSIIFTIFFRDNQPTQNFEPPSDRPKRKRRKELRLQQLLHNTEKST